MWPNNVTLASTFGMLLMALLLSLGAPFWYGILARLLQLRSALAFKEDKQRSERQATTTPAALQGGAPGPAVTAAEVSVTHLG
jgi:hypothetical protein